MNLQEIWSSLYQIALQCGQEVIFRVRMLGVWREVRHKQNNHMYAHLVQLKKIRLKTDGKIKKKTTMKIWRLHDYI
jgi:hypothetical protein